MSEDFAVVTATGSATESPARATAPSRSPLRVAAVQHRWHADRDEHSAALADGIATAADLGARLVALPELTLSPYFAVDPDGPAAGPSQPEDLRSGPTFEFAAAQASRHSIYLQASLYERAESEDGLGFNTAIVVGPDGELASRTRKLHIPVTAGYHEDRYFRPGPASADAGGGFPVLEIEQAAFGFPTCWDQWFPELARAYALEGADVLVYPTAIGSEPDHPQFDTRPQWQAVMVGHAIANGLFVIATNRVGFEDPITFYGSSFIADPYGRILVQAPRDRPAVIAADLDLDQRRDWLDLFPFLATRRPDAYSSLT
ncbi:MAG TPA: nitrilase-related carbon-nitrogen hydrolase [Baekduia sp.]|nr:nitrilase-related carbon-nitrogen hydrolase [Baekduia sp.]